MERSKEGAGAVEGLYCCVSFRTSTLITAGPADAAGWNENEEEEEAKDGKWTLLLLI